MSQEFLNGFHAITSMCIPVFFFILFFLILILISISRKGIDRFKYNVGGLYHDFGWKFIAVLIIAAVILINSTFYFLFGKDDMDALYENKEYTQSYEAYLYESAELEPYFLIIEIEHSNGDYTITRLHLPHFSEDVEIEYDNTKDITFANISHWNDLEIMIRRGRVADSDSFYRLSLEDYDYAEYGTDTVISLDTIVYFTESGKKFHVFDCASIKGRDTIATSIYYAYDEHGKTPCQLCLDWLNLEDLY